MIPQPWTAVVLTLGAYRLTRLFGWDDFPWIEMARDWLTGMYTTAPRSINMTMQITNEIPEMTIAYRRPLVAALFACPFCLGFWISAATYIAWYFQPYWTLVVVAPFALSAAVGLTARRLDP